ncbi:MAG: mycothiol system anti-sigma-R factor [Acidobacteria bacterium]|nr:mycothiol system anti-sigma-R factor [Acidobacteriota bacterium]
MDEHVDPADCTESVRELYTFLDGELTVERRVAIRAHLEGCSDCYGAYDFEAELRQVVSSSCKEEVPEQLRNRVAAALQQLMNEDGR